MVDRAVHAAWGRAVVEHYGSGRGVKVRDRGAAARPARHAGFPPHFPLLRPLAHPGSRVLLRGGG